MNKVRYAIAGFGGIAAKRIAGESFDDDTACAELVGVTDKNRDRKSAAEERGLKWFDSMDEILNSDEIDAVYIATGNSSHAPLAKQAMLAGKHVIAEKPMAVTSLLAAELCELARSRQLSLAVNHMMLGNQLNNIAAEIIKSDELGSISHGSFHSEFLYGSTPEEAQSWRCSNPDELGGPIGDVGSHCFYMAEYLMGTEITTLQCVYLPKSLKTAVEDGALITCRMSNGTSCHIRISFSTPHMGPGAYASHGYEIYGSNAMLRGVGTLCQLSGLPDEPFKIRLEVENSDGCRTIKPDNPGNIYRKIITGHAKSILAGKPMSGLDGLHNVRLCEAAHKSALNNGTPIDLNDKSLF